MLRRFVILGAGLLALTAVAAAPVAAQYGPDVEASRPAVGRGERFSVSGSGFAANAVITLTLIQASAGCDQSEGGVPLGSAAAAGDGTFTAEVTIPSSVTAGSYLVCARHLGVVAQTAVEVLGAGDTNPTPPGGGGAAPTLPRTGSDTAPYAALGAGLLSVGGLAVLVARRRPGLRGASQADG
ncbi:MAG: hypothetical protein JWM47_72 [Acidimicrobiales bacterium]|nr:hypothetical protein [Acidimicrobiales bacterium]